MKAEIIKQANLEGIPSASGIEVIDGMIYVVGDDSPYLYCLDPYLNLKVKVELYTPKATEEGRIPKKKKHDLEAITDFKINGFHHILILGSGSRSPERDKAYLIKLPTPYNRKHLVWEKDLTDFYNFLRTFQDIIAEGKLNIEGAATGQDFLVLYNRSNKNGKNAALYFQLEEFVEFIQGHTEGVPFPKIRPYNLPIQNNKEAGFSGATIFDNKLFFTASIEHTDDAYADGEVGGSLLGWKKVNPFQNLRGLEEDPITDIIDFAYLTLNGEPYKGKVESVSIFEKLEDNKYTGLAVTDNDDGFSQLLMLNIEL